MSQLHLISRYSGSDRDHAPLHHLGKGEWEKAKRKASQQVRDTAAELLHLYALRENRPGMVFKVSPTDYEAFAEGFPFEETPDQQAAIDAVLDDMQKGKPMDRLVCGDVGFGKTEVALRAAFIGGDGGTPGRGALAPRRCSRSSMRRRSVTGSQRGLSVSRSSPASEAGRKPRRLSPDSKRVRSIS